MKRTKIPLRSLLMGLLLVGMNTGAWATSWRVNSNATNRAHFADINAAMSSDQVQPGDTLYLDPGTLLPTTQTVSKTVTIIGPGWGDKSPYRVASITGDLTISAPNVKLMGLNLARVGVGQRYLVIERCKLNYVNTNTTYASYVTIRNCYCTNSDDIIVGRGNENVNSSYWTIENNIIVEKKDFCYVIQGLLLATIRNNLFVKTVNSSCAILQNLSQAYVANNIIIATGSSPTMGNSGGIFVNNIISNNFEPDNNITGITSTAQIFTGDYEHYTLIEDSPAKNAGVDGTDIGIFGGLYPYVAGGFPFGMPHFDSSIVGTRPEDGQVRVSQQVTLQKE